MWGVAARADEIVASLPGDDLVVDPDVVMDRAFTLPADPDAIWPWFVQLGKRRAGWYLPRWVERFEPRGRRGLRRLDPDWQSLAVGDVIPDWGGRRATFEVAILEAPFVLVHRSVRGRTQVSWAIVLRPEGGQTRVQLRLRLGPVRRRRLAEVVGGGFDLVTVAGLAAGLRERLDGIRDTK
jgi:hypothetical protein